jgi:hypothetical protein
MRGWWVQLLPSQLQRWCRLGPSGLIMEVYMFLVKANSSNLLSKFSSSLSTRLGGILWIVWEGWAPSKVMVFLWQLLRSRIPNEGKFGFKKCNFSWCFALLHFLCTRYRIR